MAFDSVDGKNPTGNYSSISKDLVLQKIQATIQAAIAEGKTPLVRNTTASNLYGAYISNVTYITDRLITFVSLRTDPYKSKGQLNLNNNKRADKFKQTAWSPKVGIVYQILKGQLSAYGNYMNGFSYTPPCYTTVIRL